MDGYDVFNNTKLNKKFGKNEYTQSLDFKG